MDFPGLYTSSDNRDNILSNAEDLLCIDGFLFLFKGQFYDHDYIKLITNIEKKVKERNENFSFKSCLFIRTFIDEEEDYENKNIKKYKAKMKEDIKTNFTKY